MSENKIQKKHKFLNKSQEFNSGDKTSNKVNQSNMFQTPKQTKFTPKIKSEQKQNMKKLNKKRKSLPANLINDDNSDFSSKKPKVDPFTGTSDLFMEVKSENSVVKTKNTKINKTNKKNQSPINSKVSGAASVRKAMNERAKRRKEKLKTLRAAAKENFKKMIADGVSGDEAAINSIKEKIAKLEENQQLSSSSKGKLRILKKALKDNTEKDSSNNKASGSQSCKEILNKPDKTTTKKQLQNQIKKQKATEKKINGNDKKSEKKNFQAIKEEDDSEDVDEEEEEDENNVSNLIEMESIEEEDNDDENDVEEEEDDEGEDDDDDEESDENENKSENESEENSSDEEDESEIHQKTQSTVTKKKKTEFLEKRNNEGVAAKGQSRYVLFVGNLPFDATKEEIIAHFTKVGSIKDVRIPLREDTNKSKGFAYVEFLNQTSYEKALSLHHTSLKGRRINVLYTQGGKKKGEEKKKEIKAKNLKLQAMRQGGKLAGSVKQTQKRSARRERKRNAKKDQ